MNVTDILLKTGNLVLKTAFPAASGVIDLVNSFFDDNEKLPDNATGAQVQEAINKLPPEVQGHILVKKYDVDIARISANVDIVKSMNEADGPGSSTRPKIANRMAWLVTFAVGLFIIAIFRAIWTKDFDTIEALSTAWMLMGTVIGTPTIILISYFNARTSEKEARYAVMSGRDVPIKGVIPTLLSVFKK